MARNFGIAIGQGVNSLARGLELGQNLRAAEEQRGLAAEDQAFIRKERARKEEGWQREDADRTRQSELRQLTALRRLVQSGAYEPNTPQGQKTIGYLRNMTRVFDTIDNPNPQDLEAARQSFNDRHSFDINKGTGKPLENDVGVGGGQTVPKGSVINRKEISKVFPRRDGSVLFAVKSYATTPDGNDVEWENFVTENRSTNDDDPVAVRTIDDLYRTVIDDMRAMEFVGEQGHDQALALLDAQILERGGEIEAVKPEGAPFNAMVGGKPALVQRYSDGSTKPVEGMAPYDKPEKETWNNPIEETGPDGNPILVRYSNLGSRQVVDGAMPKPGSRGLSVTTPDGVVLDLGGPGGGKPPSGYRWKADGSGLEPIPGGPEDPNAPRKPGAEVQRMNIALEALQGGLQAYDDLLGRFNARSFDQLNPTQRAEAASLVADLRLQFKEAQALGALTGPDITVLDQLLSDPTSTKAVFYGNDGLRAQLQQARQSVARRKAATDKITGASPGDADGPGGKYREGQTATNPQTGERLTYRNGRWERL